MTPAPATTTSEPDVDELLLGFARALRAAGIHVTADRERTFLIAAATVVGLDDAGGDLLGRPGRRSARSPDDFAALRPGLRQRWFTRRVCPGRRRSTPQRAAGASRRSLDEHGRAGAVTGEADMRPGDGERAPRCCGTATSPSLVAGRAGRGSHARCSRSLAVAAARGAARRAGASGTAATIDARRTLRAPAAPDGRARPACTAGAAAPARDGSSCSSTSRGR